MSLVIASPCADGIILASDSSAWTEQGVTTEAPKVGVGGHIALASCGVCETKDQHFDPFKAASQFWAERDFSITQESVDDFAEMLRACVAQSDEARTALLSPPEGTLGSVSFMAASAPVLGESRLGIARVYAKDGTLHTATDFSTYTLDSLPSMRAIGHVQAAKETYQRVMPHYIAGLRSVGEIRGQVLAAGLLDVMLGVAKEKPLVGGALQLTLVRPPVK